MKIIIDYESSWRNSFLDGSNNAPLPKGGRNFIASMKELKKENNFISRLISKDTVLGILNRLIGDQRKLYQSRAGDYGMDHYFAEMESQISFYDKLKSINHEVTYIRNMKGSTDQNSFTGMICVNDPIFQSEYSSSFWGVLGLSVEALFDFVLEDKPVTSNLVVDPVSIMSRLEEIKKMKPIENRDKARATSEYLHNNFEKYNNPVNDKGQISLLRMYCSSLYLQLQRLESKYDMKTAKSKMGGISGISNNGFTPKDFMDKYTTGAKKFIYGNPYVNEKFVKGEGKIKNFLIKASGQLIINLDINLDKAIELKTLIDNAGVSAFYLGKKGLAYISSIDVR